MSIVSKLFGGGLGQAAKAVSTVASVFRPNAERQAERDDDQHMRAVNLVASAQAQYAKEFHKPTNWFDSLINGINRLPRPAMALGVIWLVAYAFINPIRFAAVMQSMDLIPLELWMILSTVVVFYFGGKMIEKRQQMSVSADQAKHVGQNIKDILALEPPKKAKRAPEVGEIDADHDGEQEEKNAPADRLAKTP